MPSRDNSHNGKRLLQRIKLRLVKNFIRKFTQQLLLIQPAQRNPVTKLLKEIFLLMDLQRFILIQKAENGLDISA